MFLAIDVCHNSVCAFACVRCNQKEREREIIKRVEAIRIIIKEHTFSTDQLSIEYLFAFMYHVYGYVH